MKKTVPLKTRKKLIVFLCCLIATVIIGSYAFSAYAKDYYHALDITASSLTTDETVTISYIDKNTICFMPQDIKAGIIFYPGGKVEYTAYAPLLHQLAENGYLCILPQMPYNLAVFDINAADDIPKQFSDITSWYLAGHSLGGAMASSYIAKHTSEYDGLILLGAYAASDLSDSNLRIISLYGSNDQVLNHEKYEENYSNLPSDFHELVIDGGCHAYFGCYGPQEGDGTPTITNQEQIATTVDYIVYTLEE